MPDQISAKRAAFEFKQTLILKVAAEQFFAKGFARTRIDDIADALQMTKPFIYYHFPSKLHLLEAVCGHTTATTADLAEAALDASIEPDAGVRLRRFIREFLRTVLEEHVFLSIFFRESRHLPADVQRRHREDRQRFHAALAKLLLDARAQGRVQFDDLSVTGQTVTGMMTWVFNWYRPDGPLPLDAVASQVESLVLSALRFRDVDAVGPTG